MIDAPKDVGFNKPAAPLHANTQAADDSWTDLGPADLSCLGTATGDLPTAVAITLNTVVKDFQSGNALPLVAVTAFKGIDPAMTFDTETSDANGNITFHIPTGVTRFGFKMTADSQMPTFLMNQYVDPNTTPTMDPSKIQSVSNATGATLPALIGETRTVGTGVIAGALRDCQLHEMSNFIATVSSTPTTATAIAGAEAYYFSAGVELPVHHSQQDASSGDGIFMVIQLPVATTAYVQMWGYPTAAVVGGDLTLIAQLAVPVLADTVITGSYVPLRQ